MNNNAYQSLLESNTTITIHCAMLRSLAQAFFVTGNEKTYRELETAAQIIQANADKMIDIVDEHTRLDVEADMEQISLMVKRFGDDSFTEMSVMAQKTGGKQ